MLPEGSEMPPTDSEARRAFTDPAVRRLVQEETYQILSALQGKAATREQRERIDKLFEDEDFETLGKEVAAAVRQGLRLAEAMGAVPFTFDSDRIPTTAPPPEWSVQSPN